MAAREAEGGCCGEKSIPYLDKVSQMSSMEVDTPHAAWRKSRRSVSNGACVEVAPTIASVIVRDSVDPSGPVIKYSARTWQAFIADTKAGTFDAFL